MMKSARSYAAPVAKRQRIAAQNWTD